MSDPCSKETNDKVMERIRKEFVATPTVEELEAEIERLKEGRCRLNCRTAKQNWMQGYIEAQHNAARGADLDAQEAWNDVRKR